MAPTHFKLNSNPVNHIMYADDLVLIAPSVAGMNKILKLCKGFGSQHDIKYNPTKSCSMSFRSKLLKGVTLPKFVLNGEYIDEVEQSKYLGHIFTNDLTDNADIARQCRQLYAQGNMILRKFPMYSRCEIDSISHLLYPNVHITAMVEL